MTIKELLNKVSKSNRPKLNSLEAEGTCFVDAYNYFTKYSQSNKELLLVHGLVRGFTPGMENITYTHAWVEDGNNIINLTLTLKPIDKKLII